MAVLNYFSFGEFKFNSYKSMNLYNIFMFCHTNVIVKCTYHVLQTHMSALFVRYDSYTGSNSRYITAVGFSSSEHDDWAQRIR